MGTFVITGAPGFLGRALCAELGRRGHDVTGLGRRDSAQLTGAVYLKVPHYHHFPELPGAVGIHLAGDNNVARVEQNPETARTEALDLARSLLAKPVARWVYVSSAVVYGDRRDHPLNETDPVQPMNAYSRLKLDTEALFLAAGHCVVRPSNLIGEGMSTQNVLSDILAQVPGEGPVRVRDTESVRDYLEVGDAAAALALVAEGSATGIYNLGSGEGTSVRELARTTLKNAGEEGRTVLATQPPRGPSVLVLDASKLRNQFHWRPRCSLAEAIRSVRKLE